MPYSLDSIHLSVVRKMSFKIKKFFALSNFLQCIRTASVVYKAAEYTYVNTHTLNIENINIQMLVI